MLVLVLVVEACAIDARTRSKLIDFEASCRPPWGWGLKRYHREPSVGLGHTTSPVCLPCRVPVTSAFFDARQYTEHCRNSEPHVAPHFDAVLIEGEVLSV